MCTALTKGSVCLLWNCLPLAVRSQISAILTPIKMYKLKHTNFGQRTQFISPTKFTRLIEYINVKAVSTTCCGTSVPTSGKTTCQLENQSPFLNCKRQDYSVRSSFVVDVN